MTVYIHCIGKNSLKSQFRLEWDPALFEKPMHSQTASASWSDILYCDRSQQLFGLVLFSIIQQQTSKIRIRMSTRSWKTSRFRHQRRRRRRDASRDWPYRWAALPNNPVHAEVPLLMRCVFRDFKQSPIANAFLEHILKYAAAYSCQLGIRKKTRDRLRAEIRNATETFTLM